MGDACVGKTALVNVFRSGGRNYPNNYVMTNIAEVAVKAVPIKDQNTNVELYLFDCAGQSIFHQDTSSDLDPSIQILKSISFRYELHRKVYNDEYTRMIERGIVSNYCVTKSLWKTVEFIHVSCFV